MSWAIWITGLPGSGKSVVARAVAEDLRARGVNVVVLELDAVRKVLTPQPTYSDAEREAVYRALVYTGATLVDAGTPVIFDATAHRRAWRDLARAALPAFAEIQLLCPLEVCRQREAGRPHGAAPPGIYGRATSPGARVPGVNVEYELARSPELRIDTTLNSVKDAAATIVAFVQDRFLAASSSSPSKPAHDRLELLESGSAEQQAISRRARDFAASLARYASPATHRPTRDAIEARERMVERQIADRGVRDVAVLAAMRKVPRELFIPLDLQSFAYDDEPLSIGEGQTISQPYIVATMIEAARPKTEDRALEIGTGSGYSAAVLASLVADVYTIERLPRLADAARQRLAELGYSNVHVRTANGTLGWPEHAPFDVIIVTASGPIVPPSLLDQLAIGGRLVMPIGDSAFAQRLIRVTRRGANDYRREELEGVVFVPLIGREGWPPGEVRD
jgi:protein-L-isoaspartate(D-aspartate) O-methyltransferase